MPDHEPFFLTFTEYQAEGGKLTESAYNQRIIDLLAEGHDVSVEFYATDGFRLSMIADEQLISRRYIDYTLADAANDFIINHA